MTILQRHVTVGTAVVEIAGHDNMPHDVHVHNNNTDNAHVLFLGDENVTTSNGLHVDGKQSVVLTLQPEDRLYSVSNHSATVAGVLDIRKSD